MKRVSKLLSVVIALTIIIGVIPVSVAANYEHCFGRCISQEKIHPHRACYECSCGTQIWIDRSFKDNCEICGNITEDKVCSICNDKERNNKIVFVVPMYCGNPSSLYFTLMERMQDYFNNNYRNNI